MNNLPCITEMYHHNDPSNTDDFAIWSEQMDDAYKSDPSSFDPEIGLVIETMLSGEPVADMPTLMDHYETAVLAYKEMFYDLCSDYEDQTWYI